MAIMTIPRPLHIVIDDLGWFCSTDDRKQGGPSRTGVTRRHCYKDYLAVNYLGEKLGMKISCAFVLGEWDPDNRLLSVKHLSRYGDGWNNAAYIDLCEMQKCADAINASPYIDFTVHGLLHGYYMDGTDNKDDSDYYYKVNKEVIMVPEEEVRHRLDSFFDLVKHYGIKKEINAFVPPTFTYRVDEISKILADYGIKYVSTIFRCMKSDEEAPSMVIVEKNGIVNVDRNNNYIPWNVYGCDFSKVPDDVSGIFGIHWPNVLDEDADKSLAVCDKIAEYFEERSQSFGTILSKDIRFCASQLLFCKYAEIDEKDGVTTVDISRVPRNPNTSFEFYISSREPLETWIGCDVFDYEKKDGFNTYLVRPLADKMRFDNV